MRRKLVTSALVLLGLTLILIISIIVYIRSGRLDLWLQRELVAALADRGIHADIGSIHLDLSGYKVTIEKLELYDEKRNRRLGSIARLETEFSVIDYFKQRITLDRVTVDQPEVWIELDEKGRSNLDTIRAPKTPAEKDERLTFTSAKLLVSRGIIHFEDHRNNISAEIANLEAQLNPTGSGEPGRFDHILGVSFNGATVSYNGKPLRDIGFAGESHITDESAEITKLDITSDAGQVAASGRVWGKPSNYEFRVRSDLSLNKVGEIVWPDSQLAGQAVFDGNIEGTGSDYRLVGGISSGSVSVEGYSLSGISANTSLKGTGSDYSGSLSASTGGVGGRDFKAGKIQVSGQINGEGSTVDLSGGLSLDSIKSGRLSLTNLKARLNADNRHMTLSELRGALLGGSVIGSATIAYGGGRSNLNLSFKEIDVGQAVELASPGDVKATGTANGAARLEFSGLNYRGATGIVSASFTAAVSSVSKPDDARFGQGPEPKEVTPGSTTGEFVLRAAGGGFTIESASVRSAQSELTASGAISQSGSASVLINFSSKDMSEVYRAADALGLIPEKTVDDYQPSLSGPGEFHGRLDGKLSAASVSGHLQIASIETEGKSLGSFEGDISYSPSLIRIENATIQGEQSGKVEFSVQAPIPVKDSVAVQAQLDRFDLGSLIRAVAPGPDTLVGGGVVTGTINLSGLPGPRSISGVANVSLSAAQFNVPSIEDDETTVTKSIDELTGKVTIANSVLTVEDLRLLFAGNRITGRGTFNLDTYQYSVNGQGANIDLSQLADVLPETTGLAGQADVSITGSGTWDDWSSSTLDASIQGTDVSFRGRELGDAGISARTQNGILRVQASGKLLDQVRTVMGDIDLRDRNYPVSGDIDFNDEDIGPYLGLFAPQLADIAARATGSIKVSGPLRDPDRIQVVAQISKLSLGAAIGEGQRYTISNEGALTITATPQEVAVSKVTFIGEGTKLTLEGTLGRKADRSTGLAIDGEINLRFLTSFTDSVFATGVARVQASAVGALDSPQLIGTVTLTDAGVRVIGLPVSVARGNGLIRFTAQQALIENFEAQATGGGRVTVAGGAALAGFIPDRWHLDIEASQLGFEYPRDTQTIADATLTLQGNRRVQVLSGDVSVRRASYSRDVTLEELITTGGPFTEDFLDAGPGGRGGPSSLTTTLDVRVTADNTLAVRNNLADAIGSAYLSLRGNVNDPLVSGRVLLTRGSLEFRNGRHELNRGLITLQGRRGAQPVLDFQSEAEISGYRIWIEFKGPLNKLETILRSDPELPERDIISLVVTGRVSGDGIADTRTPAQTGLGLAQSLLAAGLLEQFERGTQRLFGLSRFSIDPLIVGRGSDPTARITLGQQVAKNLTITYSQNLTSGVSGLDRIVLVEYRLSNRFSIVGFRNDRSELGFDVRVRKRF